VPEAYIMNQLGADVHHIPGHQLPTPRRSEIICFQLSSAGGSTVAVLSIKSELLVWDVLTESDHEAS
jgi:hypothetical protein